MRGFAVLAGVALLAILGPPAASAQTLTDPENDNCRDYTVPPGNFCGPDITSAEFSLPGDGFLHVNVTYASLPTLSIGGNEIPQTAEHIELGIYPTTATAPDLNVLAFRFSKWTATTWKLQQHTSGLVPVADGSAIQGPSATEIELRVPIGPLGNPSSYLYALNAGIVGEEIPEHPDLAPNSGLFGLSGGPGSGGGPAAAPAPAPAPRTSAKKKCKKRKAGKKATAAAKKKKKGCKKK